MESATTVDALGGEVAQNKIIQFGGVADQRIEVIRRHDESSHQSSCRSFGSV